MNIETQVATATLEALRRIIKQGPPYPPRFLTCLQKDSRASVRALYTQCLRVHQTAQLEEKRIYTMLTFEREATANGFQHIAGIDEAGRGPLAGPIVAAAITLNGPIPHVNDSKRLTPTQRTKLYHTIQNGGHHIGLAIIDAPTIDRFGIQSANYAAMAQAVAQLNPQPDFLLVDGFTIKGCPLPQKPIIKGDSLSASIAAASIVAKVTRDVIMDEMDVQYPGYGFASHKGYGTSEHLKALATLGPCPIHRKSFTPVRPPDSSEFLFE